MHIGLFFVIGVLRQMRQAFKIGLLAGDRIPFEKCQPGQGGILWLLPSEEDFAVVDPVIRGPTIFPGVRIRYFRRPLEQQRFAGHENESQDAAYNRKRDQKQKNSRAASVHGQAFESIGRYCVECIVVLETEMLAVGQPGEVIEEHTPGDRTAGRKGWDENIAKFVQLAAIQAADPEADFRLRGRRMEGRDETMQPDQERW